MLFKRMSRRQFLRLRLTVVGWVVLLALGLTLAAALNTGINLLYMLSAALLSLLSISVLVASRSLRGVQMTLAAPRAAHRFEELAVSIRLENHKWLMPSGSLRIESSNAPGAAVGYVRVLPARERAELRIRETFARRGDVPLPVYTLVTSFPFGLVEAWQVPPTGGQILVYPRVRALRTSAAEQSAGTRYRVRATAGDGDEFFSMREYIPGDDIRRISWRASARLGKLMVRELSRQNSRYILFLLDTRQDTCTTSPHFDERFEDAVELVASLGMTLLERQYNVAVECPQGVLESGEGSGQKRRLLDFLARVTPAPLAEYPVFDEHHCRLDTQLPTLMMVSPDSELWGRRAPGGNLRVLDPREVIHA